MCTVSDNNLTVRTRVRLESIHNPLKQSVLHAALLLLLQKIWTDFYQGQAYTAEGQFHAPKKTIYTKIAPLKHNWVYNFPNY